MGKEIALRVCPLDRAPMFGVGGVNVLIHFASRKATAAKLTEEAAEAFHEWQDYDRRSQDIQRYRDHVEHEDPDTMRVMRQRLRRQRERLADELSDVIVAAVDVAKVCGVGQEDLQAALDRNRARQIVRGRIDG